MPIYHWFYVERLTSQEWSAPEHFKREPAGFEAFAWMSPRDKAVDLFWGESSLFSMRRELPPGRGTSNFCQYLDSFYDYANDPYDLCWLPFEELLVDCWDQEAALVQSKIANRFAHLFSDGKQRFPQVELSELGVDARDQNWMRNGRIAHRAIELNFGRNRFRLSQLPPEVKVDVTWSETISEVLGAERAESFKQLRKYGRDSDLRILSLRG